MESRNFWAEVLMNKIIFCAMVAATTLALPPAFAMRRDWDYRIKLSKNTGGLAIEVHTFVGPAVTVGLENRSAETVRCSASFVNYPHTPTLDETRTVTIRAGKSATLAYPIGNFGSEFSTAFVDVKCAVKKPRK
jgi:hypothetical protein